MARQRRRQPGASYQKRPIPGSTSPPPLRADHLTSGEARELAVRIDASQGRYRTTAITLLGHHACGVVVTDARTGGEHILKTVKDWDQLAAG
jgi:hypothetical protein